MSQCDDDDDKLQHNVDKCPRRRRRTIRHTFGHWLRNQLYIVQWLPSYRWAWALSDLIAGITLGLTIIPESIACALLAGVPSRYGVCSAFIGSFLYILLGSIDKVIMGPTSLVALVSVQFTLGKPLEFAFILTFFSGLVQLIMSVLRLGFIFEFISLPVIKGFSSATAILVIESQLKVLLGINYLVPGFLISVQTLFRRCREVNYADLLMGTSAIAFLITFAFLENIARRLKCSTIVVFVCRYLSYCANTLIVLLTAIVSYIWLEGDLENNSVPFALGGTSSVSGLPNFTLPKFTIETMKVNGDEGNLIVYNVWDILKILNIGIIVIPIVGVLTNISIGKLSKGLVDINQELFTLGVCNVLGSCVQSMPTSGAFTRYSISTACGLKTPMANLYSGIIVLLALSYISSYFSYIPKATLAAILICSIFTLLDLRFPRSLWSKSRRDFIIWLICFVICILSGVEIGLILSILVNAVYLLYLWAKPEIHIEKLQMADIDYLRVTPTTAIYFPAINHVREKVLKSVDRYRTRHSIIPVVIDCRQVGDLDFTAANGINKLAEGLRTIASSNHTPSPPPPPPPPHSTLEDNNGQTHDDKEIEEKHRTPLLILGYLRPHLKSLIDCNTILICCDNEEEILQRILDYHTSMNSVYIHLKPITDISK